MCRGNRTGAGALDGGLLKGVHGIGYRIRAKEREREG